MVDYAATAVDSMVTASAPNAADPEADTAPSLLAIRRTPTGDMPHGKQHIKFTFAKHSALLVKRPWVAVTRKISS